MASRNSIPPPPPASRRTIWSDAAPRAPYEYPTARRRTACRVAPTPSCAGPGHRPVSVRSAQSPSGSSAAKKALLCTSSSDEGVGAPNRCLTSPAPVDEVGPPPVTIATTCRPRASAHAERVDPLAVASAESPTNIRRARGPEPRNARRINPTRPEIGHMPSSHCPTDLPADRPTSRQPRRAVAK